MKTLIEVSLKIDDWGPNPPYIRVFCKTNQNNPVVIEWGDGNWAHNSDRYIGHEFDYLSWFGYIPKNSDSPFLRIEGYDESQLTEFGIKVSGLNILSVHFLDCPCLKTVTCEDVWHIDFDNCKQIESINLTGYQEKVLNLKECPKVASITLVYSFIEQIIISSQVSQKNISLQSGNEINFLEV